MTQITNSIIQMGAIKFRLHLLKTNYGFIKLVKLLPVKLMNHDYGKTTYFSFESIILYISISPLKYQAL